MQRLCQFCFQPGADGLDKFLAVHLGGGDALRQAAEIFGHNAVIEGLQAGGLQRLAKPDQRGQAVQLTALFQGEYVGGSCIG